MLKMAQNNNMSLKTSATHLVTQQTGLEANSIKLSTVHLRDGQLFQLL